MTSLEVIDTDAFLDMPVSSQLLYFHLNARADDDGFVASPQKIIRSLGGSADDLKILIAKKFVISFEDGVCVIKHWRVNNFIRKDIYKETNYLDLKKTLFIRGNGAYTHSEDDRAIPIPEGHYKLEDVTATLTGRQLRIGKGSEGKNNLLAASPQEYTLEEENPKPKKIGKAKYPHSKEVFALFKDTYDSEWEQNTTQLRSSESIYKKATIEDSFQDFTNWYKKHKDHEFFPHTDSPYEMNLKWPKLDRHVNECTYG